MGPANLWRFIAFKSNVREHGKPQKKASGTRLAPTEGKLWAGRKDESNFVSSIRIGV